MDRTKRSVNPVLAHHRAEKAKALKRAKAQQLALREERLATRNPGRLERRLDELKRLREQCEADPQKFQFKPRDQEEINRLEREISLIYRAKRKLTSDTGAEASTVTPGSNTAKRPCTDQRTGGTVRDYSVRREEYSSSDTDEEAKNIPMPLDVENMPPPYRKKSINSSRVQSTIEQNSTCVPVKTVYEAAPALRDLRKEATQFIPAAVRMKMSERVTE